MPARSPADGTARLGHDRHRPRPRAGAVRCSGLPGTTAAAHDRHAPAGPAPRPTAPPDAAACVPARRCAGRRRRSPAPARTEDAEERARRRAGPQPTGRPAPGESAAARRCPRRRTGSRSAQRSASRRPAAARRAARTPSAAPRQRSAPGARRARYVGAGGDPRGGLEERTWRSRQIEILYFYTVLGPLTSRPAQAAPPVTSAVCSATDRGRLAGLAPAPVRGRSARCAAARPIPTHWRHRRRAPRSLHHGHRRP